MEYGLSCSIMSDFSENGDLCTVQCHATVHLHLTKVQNDKRMDINLFSNKLNYRLYLASTRAQQSMLLSSVEQGQKVERSGMTPSILYQKTDLYIYFFALFSYRLSINNKT